MKIAVAGATGLIGRKVVQVARDRGHEVVELARSLGVDLTTGAGLAERLAGVEAVIDTSNHPAQKRAAVEAFFGSVTRTCWRPSSRPASLTTSPSPSSASTT